MVILGRWVCLARYPRNVGWQQVKLALTLRYYRASRNLVVLVYKEMTRLFAQARVEPKPEPEWRWPRLRLPVALKLFKLFPFRSHAVPMLQPLMCVTNRFSCRKYFLYRAGHLAQKKLPSPRFLQ